MDNESILHQLCSNLFQTIDHESKQKGKISSAKLDELRLLLSKESNGVGVNYLESTHEIPKFRKLYCCGKEVDDLEKYENPLIFLSDKPLIKSNFLREAHNREDLICASWDSSDVVKVPVDDTFGNRAHIFLDRYPERQHSFVGLAQREKLYKDNKGRQKIVNFATRGYTLYSTKSRSDTFRPNGGLQHYFGFHNSSRNFEDSYATRKFSNNNVSIII